MHGSQAASKGIYVAIHSELQNDLSTLGAPLAVEPSFFVANATQAELVWSTVGSQPLVRRFSALLCDSSFLRAQDFTA
jgi:hypothetical protein